MYSIDGKDRVQKLSDVPQSSAGAPLPLVVATEQGLALAYLVEQHNPSWDGTTIRVVDSGTEGEIVAVVEFLRPRAHLLGPPNDEAFGAHPLAPYGLRPYAAFEVEQSSWIRSLERANRIHPAHDPRLFATLRHFIFAFHDSVFECVAESYVVRGLFEGSLASVAPSLLEHVRLNAPAG
jgi:hypothetical protein